MSYPSQNRYQAFGEGHQMGGPTTVQHGNAQFQANGVNQPIVRSGIGSSVKDADRMTYGGGSTPTSNGMSTSTYAAKRPLLNTSLGI
jgi:hypothetical protein